MTEAYCVAILEAGSWKASVSGVTLPLKIYRKSAPCLFLCFQCLSATLLLLGWSRHHSGLQHPSRGALPSASVYLKRPYFQMKPCSQAPGVRCSTNLVGNTIQSKTGVPGFSAAHHPRSVSKTSWILAFMFLVVPQAHHKGS